MTTSGLARLHLVRNTCRACESTDLITVLSYGDMPRPDLLLTPSQLMDMEPRHSLDLVICDNCSLLQITQTVSRASIYDETYRRFSSDSLETLEAAAAYAEHLIETRSLGRDSLVIELGSNDGYMLKQFARQGIPVLGVEPAAAQAQAARRAGIATLPTSFTRSMGRQMQMDGREADVIIVNNLINRVADLHGFLAGMKAILKNDGMVSFEVPYAGSMVHEGAFERVNHEQLSYFTATTLARLLLNEELYVNEMELLPANGGTLRVMASYQEEAQGSVHRLLTQEDVDGLDLPESYRAFTLQAESLRDNLQALLGELKADGVRIAGYGASGEICTLLNFASLGGRYINYMVDPVREKQQHYLAGVHLAVLRPDRLVEDMPAYVLLADRDGVEESLECLSAYRAKGGRVIVPGPQPTIV
jgi:2-polyprenyl-3-methyl-5-hydroxy-6-metoxy-1,4-benzoquinol methylase